ncbi:MAG: phosphatidylserine decarboxylase [Chloroflexi bacterium]|nr:MAG: phosphatidylserine decarboxylase [Chloroflexota bacterium]
MSGLNAAWREVRQVVLGLVVAALVGLVTRRRGVTWLSLAGLGWVVYFFRDPDRRPELVAPGLILSPADGRVMSIDPIEEPEWISGRAWQVSIFLSLFDVHVQRAPCRGQVQDVRYTAGSFAPAFLRHADSNEANTIVLQTPYGPMVVRQMAGLLARRIVCRVVPGQTLEAGERLGLIKFGSRVDLLLPENAQILVRQGERVFGGQTVIARME